MVLSNETDRMIESEDINWNFMMENCIIVVATLVMNFDLFNKYQYNIYFITEKAFVIKFCSLMIKKYCSQLKI